MYEESRLSFPYFTAEAPGKRPWRGGVGICLYFLLYFLEHLLENGILRYAFCSGAGSLLLCLLRKSARYFMADAVIMGE